VTFFSAGFFFFFFFFFFSVLGTELWAMHLPGKRSSSELNPQPPPPFFLLDIITGSVVYYFCVSIVIKATTMMSNGLYSDYYLLDNFLSSILILTHLIFITTFDFFSLKLGLLF
jgi:hypothetical protein